jgi:hypothetical protein
MFQSQSFPGPWYQMTQLTTSLVIASHTGAPSPTSYSYVGDGSITSASHVDNLHPAAASYDGETTLITTSHINVTSPTSLHHVGYDSLTYVSHVESMSPTIVNDVGGIEKPRRLRRKTKFLCRTCKGDHLTLFCPGIVGIPKAWGSPKGPSDFEVFVVFPHPISPLIDTAVMPLQSSSDHTLIVEGDVSSTLLLCILFNLELKK